MGKLLELLVPLGVNLLVCIVAALLVRAFRDSARRPRLTSPAEALQRFAEHFPDSRGSAVVAADGAAALIALEDGGVGLLQRHGHRWNARILSPARVRAVNPMPGGRVRLRLRDYGGPSVVLDPGTAVASEQWMSCLRRLEIGGHA